MNETKAVEKEKIVAEKLNGRFAMIGFIALIGAYLTTGQIIPGFCINGFLYLKDKDMYPLKVVPYIFFVAVVLSITTLQSYSFKNLHRHGSQLVGIRADFFN